MTFIQELITDVLQDDYFISLLTEIEVMYGKHILNKQYDLLSEKEYYDILRFADILSRDKSSTGRNKAYKILSLLHPFYSNDDYYVFIANSILTKLGNYPSLNLILDGYKTPRIYTLETALEKSIKSTYHQVPGSEKVFTDAQYTLFEKLKESNHYSFSGPTSFGKSFIMDSFVNYIVSERNGIDNIVILVPTRALINQVTKRLKKEISSTRYKIMSHPVIPAIYRNAGTKYIFVFTPERLIAYLSEKGNPSIDYLFVDEAQKIVALKDERAPLYYQAVSLAVRRSVKIYFASPNIPNSEIFLELFDKSTYENTTIDESPVAQNRFFIDHCNKKELMFTENGEEHIFENYSEYKDINDILGSIGYGQKNIVYCNSIDETINLALDFSKELEDKVDERIDEAIALVREYIHKYYFLIDCLKKGVAFHFGKLPQRIREKIEQLYEEKAIDYMFCTSTLLEGVNLPAQNIFILDNSIGRRRFTDVDFWNLAGRAGRLNKELSGNIFCVRMTDNKWKNYDKAINIIKTKKISKIASTVLKGEGNFYINLYNSLTGKAFTTTKASQVEKNIWNSYANIVYYQEIAKSDSVLKSNFLKQNDDAKKILETALKNNKIPDHILSQSTYIKPFYQNELWERIEPDESAFPSTITCDNCFNVLNILQNTYNWLEEENGGTHPLIKSTNQLTYYAQLMYHWISSEPLNVIINSMIFFYDQRGYIWHNNESVPFNPNNKTHINWLINDLIGDIENMLRFKIKNYLLNYYMIYSAKNGELTAGNNWADYVEYGTTDSDIIELQNIGFQRHIALLIKESYSDTIEYDDGILTGIDKDKLSEQFDEKKYSSEWPELKEILQYL